jgi:hypothetical protein
MIPTATLAVMAIVHRLGLGHLLEAPIVVVVEQQLLQALEMVVGVWVKFLQAQLSTPHQAELGIQLLE